MSQNLYDFPPLELPDEADSPAARRARLAACRFAAAEIHQLAAQVKPKTPARRPAPSPAPVFGLENATFIDWADIRQTHVANEQPVVSDGSILYGQRFEEVDIDGDRFMVMAVDKEKGYREIVRAKQHEGSHSTKLLLRSDGRDVRLSGNVGRFARPDNVFNYGLEETVSKANQVISGFDLSPFTRGERVAKPTISDHDRERGVNPWTWTGAHFQELHATRNHAAGSEALAKESMRYMLARRGARLAKGVYGDETLVFGSQAGKLHKRVVVYRKAAEMLAHARGDEAKAAVKASQEYQFAQDVGLIRVECKWGRDFLRDNGLRYLGDATMAKIISIFERETEFLLHAEPERVSRLIDDMPKKLKSMALHWIRGEDIKTLCGSRATYFRTVKALRDYGIDASEPRNVSGRPQAEEALRRMLEALPEFNLRPLALPDWYGLPEIEQRAA